MGFWELSPTLKRTHFWIGSPTFYLKIDWRTHLSCRRRIQKPVRSPNLSNSQVNFKAVIYSLQHKLLKESTSYTLKTIQILMGINLGSILEFVATGRKHLFYRLLYAILRGIWGSSKKAKGYTQEKWTKKACLWRNGKWMAVISKISATLMPGLRVREFID